jgi:release factor glutamine methyltransferase
VLTEATRRLGAAGVGSPRVDAELLLAHALGLTRSRLALIDHLEPDQLARFQPLVERRAGREPLQHILGTAAFRHLELAVGPGVFIPRPETELLIDAVLATLRESDAPIVVDLGSGSGALALSVADEVPGARVYAVERSAAALSWLRRNAAGAPVTVLAADLADPELLTDLDARVDVVLSNPPYVQSDTVVGAEVAHDPAVAVFAGPDGLGTIPAVIDTADRLLRDGGVLALEHDDSHQPAVLARLGQPRWRDVAGHDDLTGRPRFVTARRAR